MSTYKHADGTICMWAGNTTFCGWTRHRTVPPTGGDVISWVITALGTIFAIWLSEFSGYF